MSDDSKPPTLDEPIRKWAFEHWGAKGIVILFLVVAAGGVLMEWDKVSKIPGIAFLVDRISRQPIPRADPNRFSVMVSHLENDINRKHERLIIEALKEYEGVQVLALDRTIPLEGPVPEMIERRGQASALSFLNESGASVLIWGTVLGHGDTTVAKLCLTDSHGEKRKFKRYDPPRVEEQLALPAVFWSDLSNVLRLLVTSRHAEFMAMDGHYIADRLPPFIDRVRTLLAASANRPGWDADARSSTRVVLAQALYVLGIQTGQNKPLFEAIALLREALKERTRERVPIEWAATQNSLGAALLSYCRSESASAHLEEAVIAFREALKERTRERVPLDWAKTQNNLAGALTMLGQREKGIARLEEAVAAYREVLKECTRDQMPLEWAGCQNNLGNALRLLGEREKGTARLEEAASAYTKALPVFESAHAAHAIEGIRANLQRTESLLQQRGK